MGVFRQNKDHRKKYSVGHVEWDLQLEVTYEHLGVWICLAEIHRPDIWFGDSFLDSW